MPRYKDSPEVRAAKQERREKLRELLALMEAEDVRNLKSVFKEMVGEVLENGLEPQSLTISSVRQYNQGTMLPIAENLSVYIASSFEIRQYSRIPRLHKRKNFLAMGQGFCKKTVLLSGATPDRGILTYCERRATMPITAPFLQKSIVS